MHRVGTGGLSGAGLALRSRQRSLNSRDIIGMAKGILMNRDDLTDDQAFNLLVSASQHANMKVHDVARWLIAQANDTAHGRRE
ncbi:ANTAR domain-containing protein [Mycobacterium sp.]|uniref:ANTAR domain-containing protein n=1 Tax=Mycobacterium sp. TaxID=1785 RepID=UPI003F95DB28